MSIIKASGLAALDATTAENKPQFDRKEIMKYLKSGESMKVRVQSLEDVVQVDIHSVYNVFNSTACTGDDLYDKAVTKLYELANAEKDDKKAEALKNQAYLLKAKPRFLFGFVSLETGKPVVMDFSKKQAQGIKVVLEKYKNRLGKYAFEISKSGSGTSTTLTMSPIVDLEEDLTAKEREVFEGSTEVEIPKDIYESLVWISDEEQQIEDLKKFGFDTNLIGVSAALTTDKPEDQF